MVVNFNVTHLNGVMDTFVANYDHNFSDGDDWGDGDDGEDGGDN